MSLNGTVLAQHLQDPKFKPGHWQREPRKKLERRVHFICTLTTDENEMNPSGQWFPPYALHPSGLLFKDISH